MSTPFIDTECLKWANRKDLPEFWQKRIVRALNEIDWRGALSYEWQCWLEAQE